MVGSSVKIDKFIFDYFEQILNGSDINRTNYIYDILVNCSYNSENNVFDKKMITLYFTDEQLSIIKTKQKELGYKDNFSKFIRYALFDEFIRRHNIILINTKLIDYDKFNSLLDRCKNELLHGDYTSYDLDLLRNNEKYKDFLNIDKFNNIKENESFSFDYLEYNMLMFLSNKFEEENKYSELIGLSTEDENVKNIVPDKDSFYYLFLYYAFIEDPGELDIDEIFDETDEYIELLLKKYTFEKILRYYKQKYNVIDIDKIFNKKCIENLKSDGIIKADKTTELEVTKSDEVV